MYKKILAFALLAYSVFGFNVDLSDINIPSIPVSKPILNIEKPTPDILKVSEPISKIVSDKEDRQRLAIFNYEFSKRILEYNTNSQQVNDVYVLAGRLFFDQSLVNKYDGLAQKIQDILENILGSENSNVTEPQKQKLSSYFKGVAWSLVQKG
tara:strand:+ start:341 stop:799 length:459 start_codon:yes stop_codon:yes gene_type:complete